MRVNKLTLDSKDLCEYAYLGMSSAVTTRYLNLATSPSTVAEQNFATGGPGAGRYAGFDRFGRIIETLWKDSASTTLQNAKYGYNQASNRIWRKDVLAVGKDLDNFYWYDDLYQVTAREQGTLDGTFPDYTGITNPPSEEEDFCHDETGNWLRYDNKGMAGPDPLHQQRQHNKANEITSITNPSSVIQPSYDPAGNMTKLPQPGDWAKGYDVTWDGWNRIVKLEDSATNTTIARYAYDGLTRRTEADSGENTDVRHYYYNRQWRCVEEYLNTETSADRRYAWSPRSRWQMILRQRSDTGTLDENLHTLYDAMDPVAVVNNGGVIRERYSFSAYGETTILKPDFTERATGSDYGWNLMFHVEFKDETGLYNYGYRYLSSELGRWLSNDLLQFAGGSNFYEFSRNSGVNGGDVLGLYPNKDLIFSPADVLGDVNSPVSWYIPDSAAIGKVSENLPSMVSGHVDPTVAALASLADHFFAGKDTDGGNKFVYTCKCGWIDIGHFFMSALAASLVSRMAGDSPLKSAAGPITALGSHLLELHQAATKLMTGMEWSKGLFHDINTNLLGDPFGMGPHFENWTNGKDGWSTSAYTLEDIPSNTFGAHFGAGLGSFSDISTAIQAIKKALEKFLSECGAVNTTNITDGGATAGECLKKDAKLYQEAADTPWTLDPSKWWNALSLYNFTSTPTKTKSHDCVCDKEGNPINKQS